MAELLQQIVEGLGGGAVYAALALALVLTFRATGVVNLAQGEMAMFATYVAWQLHQLGLPLLVVFALAMVAGAAIAALVERAVIAPMGVASPLAVVIVTVGLFLAFDSLAIAFWGPLDKAFPSAFAGDPLVLGDVRLSRQALGTLAVLCVVVLAMRMLFAHTRIGLAMRAIASNPESARLVGVSSSALTSGWALAGALGALAGMLAAPALSLSPSMMTSVLVHAFAAATLAGFTSPLGAVAGGLVVGVAETLGGAYIGFVGGDLKVLIPIVLMVAVLLARPAGLRGSIEVARA